MHPLMTHPMYGWLRQKPAADVWWEPNPELADSLLALFLHNERGGNPRNLVDGSEPSLTGSGWTREDGPYVGLKQNNSGTSYYVPAVPFASTTYTLFGWATSAGGAYQEFIDDDESAAPDRRLQFRLTDTNKVDLITFNAAGGNIDNIFSGSALTSHQLSEGFTLAARQNGSSGACSVWQDGIKGNDSTLTGTKKNLSTSLRVGLSRVNVFPWNGTIYLWAAWDCDATDSVIEALSDYPALLVRPVQKRVYARAASAAAYVLSAGEGSFALTGASAGLRGDRKLAGAVATYAFTGSSVTLRAARLLAAAAGSYTVTVGSAGLYAARRLAADSGAYAISGQSAALRIARYLGGGAAAYSVTVPDAGLSYSGAAKVLAAEPASYALTGGAAALRIARRIAAAEAIYALTGSAASLLWSGAVDVMLELSMVDAPVTICAANDAVITECRIEERLVA